MHSETVMLVQQIFMSFLIIFLTGVVGGKVAEKLRLPDVAIYMLIGIVIGPSLLGWIDVTAESALNQIILIFGACFIIFHGGMITSFSVLRQVWGTITLLSTLGVIITAVVVAYATHLLIGMSFLSALLLGAILASTDPAALVPIFQKFPVRQKVAQTVISESAFTDATGAIMTTVVFGLLLSGTGIHWGDISLQFLQLSLGGIVVGAIVGAIAALLISENDRGLLREFTPMVVVLSVLSAYLISERIHASGFMGVFVAGLVIGNAKSLKLTILPKQEHAAHEFMDTVGLKLRMLIFILLGSQVDFHLLSEYWLLGLAVVIVFIMLARPLTVLFSLLPDRKARWTRNEVLFFFWTRETGVIAAALIGIVSSAGLPESPIMSAIVFIAILVTLLLQASTTPFVAKKLNLLEEKSTAS